METIYMIGGLAVLIAVLSVPQALGLFVHYRMKRFPRAAYPAGVAITMVLSFGLLRVFFFPPVQPGERMCGLAEMAGAGLTLFFTGAQIVLSLIAQYWFYRRSSRASV